MGYSILDLISHSNVADPSSLRSAFQDMVRNESDRVVLFCQFSGVPVPDVEWSRVTYLNETETLNDDTDRVSILTISSYDLETKLYVVNSTLEILSVQKSDQGEYTCVGVNGVNNLIGALDRSSGYIEVQGRS